MSGVLNARWPTTSSGVLPLPTSFSRSARVSAKKRGVMFVMKKLSSQLLSSKLRAWRADLSKIRIGPAGMSHDSGSSKHQPSQLLLLKLVEEIPQLFHVSIVPDDFQVCLTFVSWFVCSRPAPESKFFMMYLWLMAGVILIV